jgi:hypothetical protein
MRAVYSKDGPNPSLFEFALLGCLFWLAFTLFRQPLSMAAPPSPHASGAVSLSAPNGEQRKIQRAEVRIDVADLRRPARLSQFITSLLRGL